MSLLLGNNKRRTLERSLLYWDKLPGFTPIMGNGFSCTRANTATRTDLERNEGVDVAANTSRHEAYGILIEPPAENKVLQSGDFSDAAWTKTNCSISTVSGGAPDGVGDSYILTANSGTSLLQQGSLGSTKNISIYAKIATGYSAGSLVLTNDGVAFNTIVPTAEWQRFDFNNNKATGSVYWLGWAAAAGTEGVEIAFAQIEDTVGATSYIKTEGSAVTRAFDQIIDTAFTDATPNTDYAFAIDFMPKTPPTEQNETLIYVDGESFRSLQVVYGGGPYTHKARWLHGSTPATVESTTTLDVGKIYRIGVKFDKSAEEVKIFINGVLEGTTDTTGETITGSATAVHLGYANVTTSGELCGWVSNFKIAGGTLPTDYEMRYL